MSARQIVPAITPERKLTSLLEVPVIVTVKPDAMLGRTLGPRDWPVVIGPLAKSLPPKPRHPLALLTTANLALEETWDAWAGWAIVADTLIHRLDMAYWNQRAPQGERVAQAPLIDQPRTEPELKVYLRTIPDFIGPVTDKYPAPRYHNDYPPFVNGQHVYTRRSFAPRPEGPSYRPAPRIFDRKRGVAFEADGDGLVATEESKALIGKDLVPGDLNQVILAYEDGIFMRDKALRDQALATQRSTGDFATVSNYSEWDATRDRQYDPCYEERFAASAEGTKGYQGATAEDDEDHRERRARDLKDRALYFARARREARDFGQRQYLTTRYRLALEDYQEFTGTPLVYRPTKRDELRAQRDLLLRQCKDETLPIAEAMAQVREVEDLIEHHDNYHGTDELVQLRRALADCAIALLDLRRATGQIHRPTARLYKGLKAALAA